MRDIPLNDYCINILNDALWFAKEENYKKVVGKKLDLFEKADFYTGLEHFEEIKSSGTKHSGFPHIVVGYSFCNSMLQFDKENPKYESNIEEITYKQKEFLTKIQTTFNLKRNALFTIYPPGGYISWHNNANASAYNFVFTWSETGDGYWQHYDQQTKEHVVIPDVKGWQCKAGYFGSYSDGEDRLVYHTARTNCLRMTVAFVLDRSEMSVDMQNWVIEDIIKN
jgi:hypothetical protein